MANASWGRSLADDTEAFVPPCRAGDEANPENTSRPHARQLVYDRATQRFGEIMPSPIPDRLRNPDVAHKVMLRPVGGGCEWPADPDDIDPVHPFEGGS
jgi:hypothetical protein